MLQPITSGTATIDVWDVETFDRKLLSYLEAHSPLIRDYFIISARLWLEYESSDHTMPRAENTCGLQFNAITEHIMSLMEKRVIRGWHYTRLTDDEAQILVCKGIYLPNLETIRSRLSVQVETGLLSQEAADQLYTDSPYQSDQREIRSDKFWLVSHPKTIDDSSVKLLLESWGGEAVYFWQRDPALRQILKSIGRARVVEVAVPLARSRQSYQAASAVIAAFGRKIGCKLDESAFDLYTNEPLCSSHILALHSQGEPRYSAIGRTYP